MAKAFLLHPDMPSVLKLLVTQMLSEQIEDTVSIDIGGPIHTAPAQAVLIKDHELSKEELDTLIALPEPQRCYEWYAKRSHQVAGIHKPCQDEVDVCSQA